MPATSDPKEAAPAPVSPLPSPATPAKSTEAVADSAAAAAVPAVRATPVREVSTTPISGTAKASGKKTASADEGDNPMSPCEKRKKMKYPLDRHHIGQNTPMVGRKSRGKKSDVWESIKRLKGKARKHYCSYTHVCMHCLEPLKLTQNQNGCWQTTRGLTHLKECSEFRKAKHAKTEAVIASRKADENKKKRIQSVLYHVGSAVEISRGDKVSLATCKGGCYTPNDAALAQQAR